MRLALHDVVRQLPDQTCPDLKSRRQKQISATFIAALHSGVVTFYSEKRVALGENLVLLCVNLSRGFVFVKNFTKGLRSLFNRKLFTSNRL